MRMNLKTGKTEMMIFAVFDSHCFALKHQHQFTLTGQTVKHIKQHKYFGRHVHEHLAFLELISS